MINLHISNNNIKSKINATKNLQSSQDTCLCQNKTPELVTTVKENEIVCSNCGMVFGFNEDDNSNTIPYYHTTKSKINLYQKRQKGGNPHDAKKIQHLSNLRLENNNSDIISFADICDKLKLSDITSEICWKSYCTLKKQTSKFTRAKAMCLVIYQTCRENRIPFDEGMVQDIVCQSLGVKKAPKLKSVIFKIGPTNKTTENNNKRQFYLNQHLSQAQKRHELADITSLQHLAVQYYENFMSSRLNKNKESSSMNNNHTDTITDYNILAKRAVLLAIQRCVV